jgi:hypothetical protein
MANAQAIRSAVNKSWRAERGLEGVTLDAEQKAELEEVIAAAIAEAKAEGPPEPPSDNGDDPAEPEPSIPAKPPEGRPCTADLAKLGERTVQKRVMRDVQVGTGDHGPIYEKKEVVEYFTDLQGLLTYDEALTLGTQEWKPVKKRHGARSDTPAWSEVTHHTCIVGGRRFTVTAGDYKKLCQG